MSKICLRVPFRAGWGHVRCFGFLRGRGPGGALRPGRLGWFAALLAVLWLCVGNMPGVAVFAATSSAPTKVNLSSQKIALTLPVGFIRLTTDNLASNAQLLRAINYSQQTMSTVLSDPNLLVYSVSSDGTRQIVLRTLETSDTEAAWDLTTMSGSDQQSWLTQFAGLQAQSSTILSSDTVADDGTVFYRIVSQVTNGNQSFCTVWYFSIWGGRMYTLAYYNSSPTLSDTEMGEAEAAFSSMTMVRTPAPGNSSGFAPSLMMILAAIVTLALVVAVILLIRSVWQDLGRRRRQRENTEKIERNWKK